jgi:hypothetical protein
VVRPRSCRVIYYFDTPALGRRHQSFGRVIKKKKEGFKMVFKSDIFFGKGLSINDLKIHIMIILTKDDDDDDSYLLEPYDT